jgi:membrane protease YdiL (CAAX protease family)
MITLIISDLPNIIAKEILLIDPGQLFYLKIFLLITIISISYIYRSLRPLKDYFLIFLLSFITLTIGDLVIESEWYGSFINQINEGIVLSIARVQIPRLFFSIIFFVVMTVIKGNRKAFFMVKGDIDAMAEEIRGMINERISWLQFGPRFTLYLTFGLLIFLISAGGLPEFNALIQLIPIFPLILIFAAINSFHEELVYRAALISGLEKSIGSTKAVLLTALYFGIAHYYGVPYGLVGIVLSSFLGFILGKSMVETRGSFWALSIHFIMDIIIFTFIAIGSVTAGGL